jgi:hypothetical protein
MPDFLVLAAMLQLEDVAPKVMSPHKSLAACTAAAQEANQDPRMKTAEAKAMGLRFVCMKIVGTV